MKKNILFVVDNLKMGGVTKVLSTLLKTITPTGNYNIDLLVLHYYKDMEISIPEEVNVIKGTKVFDVVDENIHELIAKKDIFKIFRKALFSFKIKTGIFKGVIAKERKKLITKRYDAEIGFSEGFAHLFVAYGDTKNKIGWMHIDISVQNDSKRYTEILKDAFGRMKTNVCVSKKVSDAYKSLYGLDNFQVIHNIMESEKIISASNSPMDCSYSEDCINLVSVGRLHGQKRYDRFIESHKKLIDAGYKVNSYIVGDGPEKEALLQEIKRAGVEDSFFLLGRRDNPFPYVKNADLFVLSSDYEGLPTVLYEAIILGVPCVTTCVAGAEEILENKYGIITEKDGEALFRGIEELITDEQKLELVKKNLDTYKYDVSLILEQVEKLFS